LRGGEIVMAKEPLQSRERNSTLDGTFPSTDFHGIGPLGMTAPDIANDAPVGYSGGVSTREWVLK
jgi:hypothetical protein